MIRRKEATKMHHPPRIALAMFIMTFVGWCADSEAHAPGELRIVASIPSSTRQVI